jgi:hypothetical protein
LPRSHEWETRDEVARSLRNHLGVVRGGSSCHKRHTYRDLIERNRCEFLGLTAGTGGRQNLQFSCKLSFSESLRLIFHQFSDFRKP